MYLTSVKIFIYAIFASLCEPFRALSRLVNYLRNFSIAFVFLDLHVKIHRSCAEIEFLVISYIGVCCHFCGNHIFQWMHPIERAEQSSTEYK